jgi:hypothetical protein
MEVELSCPKTGWTSTEQISADFLNIAKFSFWAHILQQNFKFKSKISASLLQIDENLK